MRPFLKSKSLKIGDMENPWGIRVAGKVSTYDNPRQTSQRNNLGEGSAILPQKDPYDHRNHLLHQTCCDHGYQFSHSTREGFHIWRKGNHQVAAPFNDTQWHSKVNPTSSHKTSGVGVVSLSKHLRLKNQRYKNQNNESICNIPMLEQLLDPQSINRVEKYADYLGVNPIKTFGVIDDQTTSPAQELKETWHNKDAADKKFGIEQQEFSLFNQRSGKPR